KFLGKIVSIAPGGATTMDVTLPLLKEIGGEEIILPAFFSGAVLSSLVPLLVPLLIRI
ncbi:LysO family transporter, partial [Candidatus Bipolaricaulota bacterium]|nr:LysO family transporter [Candidatus Bipolaricaulota bacterium]